jgi:hypothetical protein
MRLDAERWAAATPRQVGGLLYGEPTRRVDDRRADSR